MKTKNLLLKIVFISYIIFFMLCPLSLSKLQVRAKGTGIRSIQKDIIEGFEGYGLKKTKEGFYYTLDSSVIIRGFTTIYQSDGMSRQDYLKYKKKYEGKKNCCYLVSYKGKKKNICLPEEIEGCSRYVLCVSDLKGFNQQVKKVTIPSKVRIVSVLQDDPMVDLAESNHFIEEMPFSYYFDVGPNNKNVKAINGLLYNKKGTILYGIPNTLKGKLTIPDSVRKIYMANHLKLDELVLGKNVSKVMYEPTMLSEYHNHLKLRVKKENPYLKAADCTLYSKDGKHLYFSLSRRNGTYRMPNTVETMDTYALAEADYSKVITSDRLKSIPYGSLYGERMKELIIGKSVSKLGRSFLKLNYVRKITVDKENPYLTIKGQWLYDKTGKKRFCGNDTEIVMK